MAPTVRTGAAAELEEGFGDDAELLMEAAEGDAGRGGRCSVLLELHVVGGAHLHFSLAHVFPVGAQDGAARLHLQWGSTEVEITSVE